jgi:hypothetical protein
VPVVVVRGEGPERFVLVDGYKCACRPNVNARIGRT